MSSALSSQTRGRWPNADATPPVIGRARALTVIPQKDLPKLTDAQFAACWAAILQGFAPKDFAEGPPILDRWRLQFMSGWQLHHVTDFSWRPWCPLIMTGGNFPWIDEHPRRPNVFSTQELLRINQAIIDVMNPPNLI